MTSVLKKALLGTAMAATAAVTASPADAQYYRRYRSHNDDAALAIGAGILGLGVGAAIASSNRGYYDRGYYGNSYGYYGNGYNGYYGNGYGSYYGNGYGSYGSYPYSGYGGYDGYYGRGYYDGYRGCTTTRQWDRYYRRWVRVRVC